jgi:hypothetical protein
MEELVDGTALGEGNIIALRIMLWELADGPGAILGEGNIDNTSF